MIVDLAVVITLASRADRAGNIAAIRRALGAISMRVEPAVDGVAHAERVPPHWGSSPQAWGCRESHAAVLSRLPRGANVLVLEDDAALPADFAARLDEFAARLPHDWEALMLGGQHRRDAEHVAAGVVRCVRTIRTHAYVLRADAVDAALATCREATRHWDGAFASTFGDRRRTYAPQPFIVGTTFSPSSIPDSRPLPLPSSVVPAGYAVR